MASTIAFSTLSFLVVEDSSYMRTIIRTIIHGFGCRKVYEAENGADGMDMLRSHSPDIVIVDWEMPVMDGAEMVKAIRNTETCQQAFVPIILITAHTERFRIMGAKDMGVNEILRKPISPRSLYQRVASIILTPRPFIRTSTYFGPEPRSERGAIPPEQTVTKNPDVLENIESYGDSSAA